MTHAKRALLVLGSLLACSQAEPAIAQGPSKELAKKLLALPPRPQRPALSPSRLPLEFNKGERIAFVGNSFAERMNLFGHFETLLHTRFPDKELVVRNFARPADEVGIRQRSADYTALDDPLTAFGADTYFCFFGFNESFAGASGLEKFQADYLRFFDTIAEQYPRDDTKAPPRFVVISPIAFESTGDPLLPDGRAENERLRLYARASAEVAAKKGVAFVDLLEKSAGLMAAEPGMQLTINGCHLNERGDREVARLIDEAMFTIPSTASVGSPAYEKLRAAVNDKSWVHLQDYRMLNGWYVYGGRRTWDTETFPREYVKIRKMAEVRDQYVWNLVQNKSVPERPDDSGTGDLIVPQTRFGDPRQNYSEADSLRYLTPEQLVKSTTVPPGFAIEPFADETKFPELAKPVQLNFDNKGRLWVACMPTYPQWKPGDGKPSDKLVILEDTDKDGKADTCKVFYDKLQCPTGFEFWNGGVLVVDQPRLLWLKDTDGDDKADEVVHLVDGWATDDTHHTCGAFEWNHGGALHMLEGIATSTTLETPWGPHRSMGTGGAYVMDPRTLKVRQFALPGQYNMWCYVFNGWGQGIVGDGTTANHAWDTPLSGAQYRGRTGLNMVFDNEGMRPALGSEFLVSRHFPDDVQEQFTYACVINMNGMPRFSLKDDGGGYHGARLKHADGQPDDLIRSTDKHFRPADPQIGPDGALWFGDWANALIGHMQYSQRDPNRDHTRGRIYRLVYPERPLVEPVTQFGKPVPELLDQLRQYEWRTRYRARRELRDRPSDEVAAAVKTWVAKLDPKDQEFDRLRCEALWILESHHRLDADLLTQVLKDAPAFEARAAAVRILADERESFPQALDLLLAAAQDAHPRVRTEVARGLSYFSEPKAAAALLAMTQAPADYWCDYTIKQALGANESIWRADYLTGRIAKAGPRGSQMVTELMSASKAGAAALPFLQSLLSQEPKPDEERDKAMTGLAQLKGDQNRGREVFVRTCTACHRVGNGEGREYGPNLAGVAKRMPRAKIIHSVIDPNADVDPKYRSTMIATADGTIASGLVVSENDKEVEIFDGKATRKILVKDIEERSLRTQSSMPEGTASTLAPSEFVDLIEYLGAQNQDVKPEESK
ncbi:PVC-type heme-binding CxxCH protein [Singulisphaera acidiphila]|uniref:Putative membrane-bound dehydrogenase n=1 Tax=Singulisphaera acidiphila (strain ATCC BAA-1392 / DSM 18658 / VKM B-2454 / MOB10) TaxID=886293 RepID=L0DHF9_SINAD|nr:PVC-type heme-binding CxxCH protein [Singulisphaera acidiphila]AGA28697.1 putative membrane-bound dehydrogenase [Singulisphaera acidiphila DSM 18658]